MQIVSDDIRFVAPPPAGVQNLTATVVGSPGPPAASANAPQMFWYWVVAQYPIGSVVTGPAFVGNAPMPLTHTNFVRVSWTTTDKATSYVVVRSSTPEFPLVPGNVAVSPGTATASPVDDVGLALVSTDTLALASGSPASCRVHLNNRDYMGATLQFPCPISVSEIIFPDGSSQSSAGGGGLTPPTIVAGFGIQVTYGANSVTISNLIPQTPWTGSVNGGNYNLSNVDNININGCYEIDGVPFACSNGAGGVNLSNITNINGAAPGGSLFTHQAQLGPAAGGPRLPGVVYQNNYGVPMLLTVNDQSFSEEPAEVYIFTDNQNPPQYCAAHSGSGPMGGTGGVVLAYACVTAIILPGNYYEVILGTDGGTVPNWTEWY